MFECDTPACCRRRYAFVTTPLLIGSGFSGDACDNSLRLISKRLVLAVAVVLKDGLLQLGIGCVERGWKGRGAFHGRLIHLQLDRAVEIPPARLVRKDQGF